VVDFSPFGCGKVSRTDIEKVPIANITKWVLLTMAGGRNGLCYLSTNSTPKNETPGDDLYDK
jgi:hypothetical protein